MVIVSQAKAQPTFISFLTFMACAIDIVQETYHNLCVSSEIKILVQINLPLRNKTFLDFIYIYIKLKKFFLLKLDMYIHATFMSYSGHCG